MCECVYAMRTSIMHKMPVPVRVYARRMYQSHPSCPAMPRPVQTISQVLFSMLYPSQQALEPLQFCRLASPTRVIP